MDDTSARIEQLYHEMLMAKSPVERLKMASGMYDSARELVIAGILMRSQHLTPAQLRAQLFLRMYGSDFPPAERERIIRKIPNMQLDTEG